MQVADLYIRVSTDEQAEKGFSQRNQDEVLRRYCELKCITVRKVYFEDHSAKTFRRPVWNKLLVDLRKNKGKVDVVLFTKWDRFSRNAGDAYMMINLLRSFQVEPQAIEQPLDLSIPENKMMLAFYLAAPEVENDRRSLNVFHGIRRAKKEGRWPGKAPLGYANKIDDKGHKYIAQNEPYATIMREGFERMAQDTYTVESVYNEAKDKGLPCCRNNFWFLLRNPVYCGKVVVPRYKDEDEYLADGQHEAVISEALFYRVQAILDGRKNYKTSIEAPNHLQFRGLLDCPKCTRKLTGSGSKGRHSLHYYYHCQSSCGVRFKAEEVNTYFQKQLKKFTIMKGNLEFYTILILKAYTGLKGTEKDARQQVLDEMKEQQARMSKAMDLMLKDQLDPAEYRAIKVEAEKKLSVLEARLPEVVQSTRGLDITIKRALTNFVDLNERFYRQDIKKQREIFSALFPGRVVYSDLKHRTGRMNDIAVNIALINRELTPKKNWTKSRFYSLSSQVVSAGIEPATQGFSVLCSTD